MADGASGRQHRRFVSLLSVSVVVGVAGLGVSSRPAEASSVNYHLSQDGLCNRTSQKQTFSVTLGNGSGSDKCGTARMDDRTNFHTDTGGTLDPGQCATASFYLESITFNCEAYIYVSAGGGQCQIDIGMANGTRQAPAYDGCSAPLVVDHGSEHIQVTIQDSQ
jgi:hypothetical protein